MGFFYEKCKFCNYLSDVKNNLKRHELNQHSEQNIESKLINENSKNVAEIQKMSPKNSLNSTISLKNSKNVAKIVNFVEKCPKCEKTYKNKYSLIEHEKNCNGLNV